MDEPDALERALEQADPESLRFPRHTFYVVVSIMCWVALWALADQFQHSPMVQTITWLCVLVAVYVTQSL